MSELIQKKGTARHWGVLIGCACCEAGAFAAVINLISVYLLPVVSANGFAPGDYMMFMTYYGVIALFSLPIFGNLMHKRNFNVVTTFCVCVLILSLVMLSMGAGKPIAWFWLWGALFGLGVPPIFGVMVSALINNWFGVKYRGRFLGIATAFTGVGTFVWAPLFTTIIQSTSWQTAYLINAALIAVLCLPFTLFVFKYKPSEVGLKPYGYDEELDGEAAQAQASKKGAGMTTKQAMKTSAFWLCAIVILAFSFGNGYNTNMVAICTTQTAGVLEASTAAVVGAWMVSVAAVGNILSKIIFGVMNDKVGLKWTFTLFACITICGYVLWIAYPTVPLLLVGAFFFGMHNAIISVGFPLLVREVFGADDYAPTLSFLMMFNSFAGSVCGTVAAFFYQANGNYVTFIVIGIVAAIISILCLFVVLSWSAKRKAAAPAAAEQAA